MANHSEHRTSESQAQKTPMSVRRGYVRPMTIAMATVAALAVIWAIAQAVIQ